MLYKTEYSSPVGLLTLVANDKGLSDVWIKKQKYFASTVHEIPADCPYHPVLSKAKEWLSGYFSGEKMQGCDFPLAPQGTAFQQKVWRILPQIPYGKTMTYGEIAALIASGGDGQKMSAQAVGGAVGHNPISIIIPCHRVIGANGNLTGYAGGLDIKIRLLEIEGVDLSHMFFPKTKK